MLVSVARYRTITGDVESEASAVSAAIEDATALLEDELGRPLESDERTERMYPGAGGVLYPLATPISDAGDYTIDGTTLRSGSFGVAPAWLGGQEWVEVTYTGGFVERSANPNAANGLPAYVERDLAWAAHALMRPVPALASLPAGTGSAQVGDVALGAAGGGSLSAASVGVSWSRETLRLRRRRL